MERRTLKLRTKHVIDLYSYYMEGDKESYKRGWDPDRRMYGDAFIDGLVIMMERFWGGYFTQLEVTTTADDLCERCAHPACKVRNVPDDWQNDGVRNLDISPGTYDAESIREKLRQMGSHMRRGDLPPM